VVTIPVRLNPSVKEQLSDSKKRDENARFKTQSSVNTIINYYTFKIISKFEIKKNT
jgi:hypothetical protein